MGENKYIKKGNSEDTRILWEKITNLLLETTDEKNIIGSYFVNRNFFNKIIIILII